MPENHTERPLQPGDRAPNIVLDAITRQGKVSIDEFRGQRPVLVGLFRGLHCPFCRRQIASMASLAGDLQETGDRQPDRGEHADRARPAVLPLSSAAEPARGIGSGADFAPRIWPAEFEFTESENAWPYKVSMGAVNSMRMEMPRSPEPMDPFAAVEYLDKADGYEFTEADRQMIAGGEGQLVGEFLLDRDGVVRWCFTEVADDGRNMFGIPPRQEVMSAAAQVLH